MLHQGFLFMLSRYFQIRSSLFVPLVSCLHSSHTCGVPCGSLVCTLLIVIQCLILLLLIFPSPFIARYLTDKKKITSVYADSTVIITKIQPRLLLFLISLTARIYCDPAYRMIRRFDRFVWDVSTVCYETREYGIILHLVCQDIH